MAVTGPTNESTDADAPDFESTIFLGRLADRLSVIIEDQTSELFDRHGIAIPVRSCSLIEAIAKLGAASTADLSHVLGQSHQLIAQKIPKLLKLRLISQSKDSRDARRKVFRVTKKGEDQLHALAACSVLLDRVYTELFAEVGDVATVIRRANKSLAHKSIVERIDAEPNRTRASAPPRSR